ncbi:MFS transporter [Salipaludibacillus sp. CF4.18]|uniref:MFS transporter n=1 Tax=Salipaludibacillus sp. CF4.18 TaxID=3373081 RepID=UPI003EE49A2C
MLKKVNYFTYLVWSNIAILLTLIAFSFISGTIFLFIVIMIIGLFMSGTFAIAITYANARIIGKTEKITSTMIASGGIGGALLPLLTGWSMDIFSTGITIWIFTGLQLILLILIVFTRKSNTEVRTNSEQIV